MANKIIIKDDSICLDDFDAINSGEIVSINIYGYNKVVISKKVPPADAMLDCHNLTKLKKKSYRDANLVNKLLLAGIKSGSEFLYHDGRYFAVPNYVVI